MTKLLPANDRMRNLRTLSAGRDLLFVTDDERLREHLDSLALPASLWSPELAVEEGSHVVLALCHQLVSRTVRQQFSPAAVLVLPIYSFDDSYEAIEYTLQLMLATDYCDACRRNEEWLDLLRDKPDGQFRFLGVNTDLRCQLHDQLVASTSLAPVIEKGEWVSIADYCEVSVTAPSQLDWCGAFTIDGHAEASGMLVAEDSRVTPTGRQRVEEAKGLRRRILKNAPVSLEVTSGVLTSVVAGGREWVREISDVTNPDYGLHTLELGLGSNPGIAALVDWTINSQLNEGVGRVHLGYGEGMTGAHMDFIIDRATLS
ncbi:MAG: hypothetical protein ACRDZ8_13560 [Acidimicrobiales bacterium]